jgi:hypothetical protein
MNARMNAMIDRLEKLEESTPTKTYTKDDVRKILDEVWERCSRPLSEDGTAFFYKNDNLPPRVLLEQGVAEVLNDIKGKL